jgi:hypothetical protein
MPHVSQTIFRPMRILSVRLGLTLSGGSTIVALSLAPLRGKGSEQFESEDESSQ